MATCDVDCVPNGDQQAKEHNSLDTIAQLTYRPASKAVL